MLSTDLESKSYWLSVTGRAFRKLSKSEEVDVAIIGGGITGLTAAYLLKQAGRRIAVLDKHGMGDAETGHTTAHLSMVTDARLRRLADTFGEEATRFAWEGGRTAIDTIVRGINVKCEFQHVPTRVAAGDGVLRTTCRRHKIDGLARKHSLNSGLSLVRQTARHQKADCETGAQRQARRGHRDALQALS